VESPRSKLATGQYDLQIREVVNSSTTKNEDEESRFGPTELSIYSYLDALGVNPVNIEQYFGDMRKHFVPTTSKAQFFEIPQPGEEVKGPSEQEESAVHMPLQTAGLGQSEDQLLEPKSGMPRLKRKPLQRLSSLKMVIPLDEVEEACDSSPDVVPKKKLGCQRVIQEVPEPISGASKLSSSLGGTDSDDD